MASIIKKHTEFSEKLLKMAPVHAVSLKLLANVPAMMRAAPLPYPVSPEVFQSVAPALFKRRIDSLYYLQFDRNAEPQQQYRNVFEQQNRAFETVRDAARDLDCDVCVYKGLNYLFRVFDRDPINMMHDVDLVVRRADVPRIKQALRGLGYVQGDLVENTLEIVPRTQEFLESYDTEGYELYAFTKVLDFPAHPALNNARGPVYKTSDAMKIAVSFDIHLSPSLDLGAQLIWDHAVHVTAAAAACTDLTVQVWLSALRYYIEVALNRRRRNIRELAYITAALSHPRLDWELFVALTHTHGTHPPIWYTLAFLDHVAELSIPDWVLMSLHPTKGDRTFDFGWQYPKLFGLLDELPKDELRSGLARGNG
ncbi:nucleotidyltransferase family protein [Rhodovulum sulfidophilum]|uniref:Nucleotidyltransferase family protein n=1 Tax=Rhodovulum sulfidophilum TaxID=35806 RepID=A0ABS1RWV0_RHOSU|nr:nucleotidyltransferase family protein [Rhodovulum sulfidophilum]MBL3610579.1 nucleotidyltransferase family protein [Rhodovulum sulfidophilum]MCE8456626.1 nucleotidyltransferase family protein [Rhodovulum sulfidophilum]